jgi:hypothetical protein
MLFLLPSPHAHSFVQQQQYPSLKKPKNLRKEVNFEMKKKVKMMSFQDV